MSSFARHRQRYGAPRITDDLHDEGIECSENRVARRMRALGLKAIQAKKFKVTTDSNHSKPVAPDLIEQDFSAQAPNEKWVSDISYIWTDEGWLYLAVIMDLYSRAIVGWSMSRRMTQQLVCDALTMALFRRHFPKGTIIHSDRPALQARDGEFLSHAESRTGSPRTSAQCYWTTMLFERKIHAPREQDKITRTGQDYLLSHSIKLPR